MSGSLQREDKTKIGSIKAVRGLISNLSEEKIHEFRHQLSSFNKRDERSNGVRLALDFFSQRQGRLNRGYSPLAKGLIVL